MPRNNTLTPNSPTGIAEFELLTPNGSAVTAQFQQASPLYVSNPSPQNTPVLTGLFDDIFTPSQSSTTNHIKSPVTALSNHKPRVLTPTTVTMPHKSSSFHLQSTAITTQSRITKPQEHQLLQPLPMQKRELDSLQHSPKSSSVTSDIFPAHQMVSDANHNYHRLTAEPRIATKTDFDILKEKATNVLSSIKKILISCFSCCMDTCTDDNDDCPPAIPASALSPDASMFASAGRIQPIDVSNAASYPAPSNNQHSREHSLRKRLGVS